MNTVRKGVLNVQLSQTWIRCATTWAFHAVHASLKFYTADIWNDNSPRRIILTSDRPVLDLAVPCKHLIEMNFSQRMRKPTKWHVRLRRQISLGIRPVWSESSLSAWRKLGSLAIHWAHSEDSDQRGWMPRLIWVFAGRTCHFVGFVMRLLVSFLWILSMCKCRWITWLTE